MDKICLKMPPNSLDLSLNDSYRLNKPCINNTLLKALRTHGVKAVKKYVHLNAENRLCDLLNPALPH